MLNARTHWECPNCSKTDVTGQVPNRYHACAGLNGVMAPMVPEGQKVKVIAVERQDYIGSEQVQLAPNGRPVMSVVTERPDGSNDVMVFAPSATLTGDAT